MISSTYSSPKNPKKLIVVSRPPICDPHRADDDDGGHRSDSATAQVRAANEMLRSDERAADALDAHNRPRVRRLVVLETLQARYPRDVELVSPETVEDGAGTDKKRALDELVKEYGRVHDASLIEFLSTAWENWVGLGKARRDASCVHPAWHTPSEGGKGGDGDDDGAVPPLVPCHVALHREPHQRPSSNVMGGVGYYCTDLVTPIVSTLLDEMRWDLRVVRTAVKRALGRSGDASDGADGVGVSYAVTTHPGHHAARDCFGGYCYLNHAALAARLLQEGVAGRKRAADGSAATGGRRVAIVDVDYHCGNGTASIFYEDPSVLVVSIHCDPEWEYPFNSGFSDQTGAGEGLGATLHLPLPPGTSWEGRYRDALGRAMDAINSFGAEALVVSLGLDTHDGDEVATRRAGFQLSGDDYVSMGSLMADRVRHKDGALIPTVFVQEGGYKMDVIGMAAAGVVVGYKKAAFK